MAPVYRDWLKGGPQVWWSALAYHFCLALPAAFTQPEAHLLAKPCISKILENCLRDKSSVNPSPTLRFMWAETAQQNGATLLLVQGKKFALSTPASHREEILHWMKIFLLDKMPIMTWFVHHLQGPWRQCRTDNWRRQGDEHKERHREDSVDKKAQKKCCW